MELGLPLTMQIRYLQGRATAEIPGFPVQSDGGEDDSGEQSQLAGYEALPPVKRAGQREIWLRKMAPSQRVP